MVSALGVAGHLLAQRPQPVQALAWMRGMLLCMSMAPSIGQASMQSVQGAPKKLRHEAFMTLAMPIVSGSSGERTPEPSRWQAVMQARLSHIVQGAAMGLIIGVPAALAKDAGAWMMASAGQSLTHASHLVHWATKASSSIAPGGRWISGM